MRSDEVFAMDRLSKFISGPATTTEGEDPPDFWLSIMGAKYAVEVTRISPSAFGAAGRLRNVTTENMQILGIVDGVAKELAPQVANSFYIGMFVKGPLVSGDSFRSGLRTYVRSILDRCPQDRRRVEQVQLGNVSASVAITDPVDGNSSFMGCSVINGSGPRDRRSIVQGILENRLEVKQKKMLAIPGEKWLAFVNYFPFIESAIVKEAFAAVEVTHDFKRVFLVEKNGCVTELCVET